MENSTKTENTVDLRRLWMLLRAHIWAIIAWAVGSGAVGFVLAAFVVEPKYTSTTQILVNQKRNTTDAGQAFNAQQADVQLINTYKDIVIEEDVWAGFNVTLLPGAYIGRGCILGAGAVIHTKIPPYSIVVGNPAKVIGFHFTPEEIIEHEKLLYPIEDRIPKEVLIQNYQDYFLCRIKDIKKYMSLKI